MWISGYDPCCGPRVPAGFDPPYPIQLPPTEVLPVLLKHGFMRWLPDGLTVWAVVAGAVLAAVAVVAFVTYLVVRRDRMLSGE